MKLPKYASAPICMILCTLAASSFAADAKTERPAPAAVPAAEQADYAEKMAEAAKKEAEAQAAAAADAAKKEAEAQAKAEDAEVARIKAEIAMKEAERDMRAAEAKAAAEAAKKEAEAQAAAVKAAAEKAQKEAEANLADSRKDADAKAAAEKAAAEAAKKEVEATAAAEKAAAEKAAAEKAVADRAAADKAAAAEKAKKDAEAKAANAFGERFPELAKAIADANLSAEKKAEVDVLSANLIASGDALDEITARETSGDVSSAEKLEAEIEYLTQYTAILAAVPSPENETLLADKMLELQTAREERLFLAQQEFEEGKIDSAKLREIQDKYLKLDTPAEVETVKKEKKEPFWGYKTHKPLPVLLVVANYRIPRKGIAEYLRTEYDIPYILLPSDPGKPSKDDQVFFSGGKKNSGEHEVALPAVQLSRFIAYLRPETVIILGDDSYINPVYRLAVPDSISKVEFSSPEWKVNTIRLDEFFRRTLKMKTDVSDHYLNYLQSQEKNKAE